MSSYRTSTAHFAIFQREVKRALQDLGVNDWCVTFEHRPSAAARASVTHEMNSRVATVRLARTWDEPVTVEALREYARHEALHLALGVLSATGKERYVTRDESVAAEEATVQRFLRCVRWSK